jgi:hypothetical protein
LIGTPPASRADDYTTATVFLRQFFGATAKQRSRLLTKAPLATIQRAALGHPDPFSRRGFLAFLDHYANDQSMGVFSAALRDPIDFVRNIALHSLACESCKTDELCVAEVVPSLIDVLERDTNPELRTKSIRMLLHLAGRDTRAWTALKQVAMNDPDELIREAASDGLAGRFVAPRKRYQRRQRRHARFAARRR